MRTLTLDAIDTSRHGLFCRFSVGALRFSSSLWYEGVDLAALERRSPEGARRLFFHIALFELNRLCSLRPAEVRLGPWARYLTPALERLWREIFHKVWAQWRYENDDPDYQGPAFVDLPGAAERGDLADLAPPGDSGGPEVLLLCGGGKDSLVSMRLLAEVGAAFDTCAYSSSIYGGAALQHGLIDRLIDQTCGAAASPPGPGAAPRRLRQYHYDDLMDAPVLRLHPELGVRTLAEAETPFSVFAALPAALQHGYRGLCFGLERSADRGQLRWARTGEDVNHQWGKSAAAEALLNRYLGDELGVALRSFSPLKPIYDVAIFGLLRRYAADAPAMHSCNVRKPWCLRCPKCLYVWLGCAALLPRDVVRATFGADDLLADPARSGDFAALMGAGAIAGQQPFECIGHAEEAQLYLALCAARGYRGPVLDLLAARHGPPRAALPLIDRYLDIDEDPACSAMPAALRQALMPVLRRSTAETAALLRATLEGPLD